MGGTGVQSSSSGLGTVSCRGSVFPSQIISCHLDSPHNCVITNDQTSIMIDAFVMIIIMTDAGKSHKLSELSDFLLN